MYFLYDAANVITVTFLLGHVAPRRSFNGWQVRGKELRWNIPLYTTCRLSLAAPATNVAKSATLQTSAPPLSVSAITASNLDTSRTDAHSHAPLRPSSATHAPALDTSRPTAQPSASLEHLAVATRAASPAISLATAAHHPVSVEWLLEWALVLAVADSLLAADSRVDSPHAEALSKALAQPPATSAFGHISRDCTAPNGGPLNTAGKTCYQCGEAGHISRDCPQSQRVPMGMDVDGNPIVAGIAPIA
ncbi:hypothetical protein V495_03108 [Pseudogymnoascus sp. VKM F-4514 (FW-929)]|nr:hypothetical protein V495_03108 [Pseudogymnoascus sp. VKM F-4514 (FW-929)]